MRNDLIALADEMRAEVQRIGKNYDVWTVPSVTVAGWADRLAALSAQGETAPKQNALDAALAEGRALANRACEAPLSKALSVTCGCGAMMEPLIDGPDEVLYGCETCKPGQVNVSRAQGETAPAPVDERVRTFVDWHKRTPHVSLMGDSRVAYEAQTRMLDQLLVYLEGRDDYLNAVVELAAASPLPPGEGPEPALEELRLIVLIATADLADARMVNIRTLAYRAIAALTRARAQGQ